VIGVTFRTRCRAWHHIDLLTERGVPLAASVLARHLSEQRDAIVACFVADVHRKALSPTGTSRSLLVDHIPQFIDEIVEELESLTKVRSSNDAADTSGTARRHGEQRWGVGYDIDALIREYGILRHCILASAKDAGVELSIDEFDILAKCLSVGVAEAVAQYSKHRDAELKGEKANLQFLVEAGELLSSSLDYQSTLGRLTGLLVPRMADYCAVHLDGVGIDKLPLAHVDPAKVETLHELYRSFPLPKDSPYSYQRVIQTGEPFIADIDDAVLDAIARSARHAELLRAINPCSMIVVPLRVQGAMFGALTLGYSVSRRHYDEGDLVLASEVARRAAVAIDNARLYEASQRERSRVEAATRAKDEFVAMVSHELRTPLNSILGWLHMLRGDTLSEERRMAAMDVIERNAEAQSKLVADLLDISRIITGKIRIIPSQVDFAGLVELAIEGVRPAAEAKRIRLDVTIDPDSPALRADGERLQQVVWNLLVNAVKFTPKNGLVRVTLRRVESELELIVEDNGEGIAPDFLANVFESFRQYDGSATRSHGGLGIGLSIAKHIVELHGGAIAASSEGRGRGATFTVRLPISPLVSSTLGIPRVPATRQERAGVTLPKGLEGIRVLVVEDEADARDLVAYVLESCGMEVRLAASTAEALRELESYFPTVIISDIGLPDEDGYMLIRAIRTSARDEQRDIPVIALTAFARNEDRAKALVEGFNLHMAKPVEPAKLAQAVIELSGQPRIS
jgi:signal transduction histidine kinase/ActR/RegA family two-component response regulator